MRKTLVKTMYTIFIKLKTGGNTFFHDKNSAGRPWSALFITYFWQKYFVLYL